MGETSLVLEAVKKFAYDRHSTLTKSNVIGFDEEELDRVTTTDGYLDFSIENLEIVERDDEDEGPIWYVSATIYFQTDAEPIEGSTDTYECYKGTDEWIVDWHSS